MVLGLVSGFEGLYRVLRGGAGVAPALTESRGTGMPASVSGSF